MKKIICIIVMLGISVFASEDIFDRIDKNINKGETKIDESIDKTKGLLDK